MIGLSFRDTGEQLDIAWMVENVAKCDSSDGLNGIILAESL